MANQQNSYTGSQGTGTNSADFSFTFPSFTTSEVRVEVDNVVKTLTTHYTVENYNTTSGGTVRFTTGNIPTGTTPVRIFRQTDVDSPKAEFSAGSSLKAGEINDNFKQLRHALQEAIGANTTDRQVQEFNIEDGAITSAKIKDSTIVEADLANSAITQNKLANNSVGTPELINGSVNSDKILDGTIVNADVNASAAIAGTKISPVFGSQTIITTGNAAVGGTLAVTSNITVSGTVDGRDVAADGTKLDTIETNAKDDQTASDIKTLLQSDKLTASEIAEGALDGRYFTETESDARYFNVSTGDTIKDGDTFPDNDTTIATTAAINDRIIDLVDDVGGFVPIANETSFPTANPDVNNGAGTLVSIKEISSTRTPSTGTVTIANGSGSNTVTITGCGSTVLTAGFGVIVETTTTLHTYAFHRLTPKATEVTTVAGKATEIGRLGTAAAVEDMSILGTTDVVADMAILGTTDVVADMNLLAVSDVISDMNTLAVTSVINDMDTVAGISNNVTTVAGIHGNVTTVAGISGNVTSVANDSVDIGLVADSIGNVNNVGNSITNVNTVATNISSVNNFANQYRIGANNPDTSLDVGDLFFNTTSNSLKVYTGSAWVDGVTQTGDFALKTGNTFTGSNNHNDNVKSIYGTGSDLEIYHSGNESVIKDNGTGDLFIDSNSSHQIRATSNISLKVANQGELAVQCNANGGVDLYYDSSKKFETYNFGTKTHGLHSIITGDNSYLALENTAGHGTAYVRNYQGDLLIESPDDVIIESGSSSEIMAKFIGDGAVELYHNNSKKLETTSSGVSVTGDIKTPNNGVLRLGDATAGDLKIYHNGTNTYLDNNTGHFVFRTNVASDVGGNIYLQPHDNEGGIDIIHDGGVAFYYDNSKKAETYSAGLLITGTLSVDTGNIVGNDGANLKLGTGDDLRLYHDGANSYIDETGTGSLRVRASQFVVRRYDNNHNMLIANSGGSVDLYHNNSKKLETTAGGAAVVGDLALGNITTAAHYYDNGLHIHSSGTGSVIHLTDNTSGSAASDGFDIISNAGTAYLWQRENANIQIGTNATSRWNIYGSNGHFAPSLDSTYDIGTTTVRVRNAYVDTYYGDGSNLTGINTDLVSDTSPQLGGNLASNGNAIHIADNDRIYVGTGYDMEIYHDGSTSYIRGGSANIDIRAVDGEQSIVAKAHNAVELYYDGSKKFETQNSGVTLSGDLYAGDNCVLRMGNATGGDMQIYHNGNHSYIQDVGTGSLIQTTNGSGIYLQKGTSETLAKFLTDGGVELNYDDTKRFETTSSGVTVTGRFVTDADYNYLQSNSTSNSTITLKKSSSSADSIDYLQLRNSSNSLLGVWTGSGHLKPGANNTHDLGDSSTRWRNVYTNDLHLSNEGSSNDVDGSWGDWTIQEGESDLFLKNNRSGKKFKFNLTEVS